MKKGLVSACSLVLLLLLCSPLFATGAQEKVAPSVVEVSFGYSGGVWIEQYFDQVLEGMNKALVGIQVKKVVYPTYDDLLNTLPSQVAANTNPDILYWTNEQLAEYVNNQVLARISHTA